MDDAVNEVLSAFSSSASDVASSAGAGASETAVEAGTAAADTGGAVADAASAAGGTGNAAADIGAGAADAAGTGSDAASLLGATSTTGPGEAVIGGATGAASGVSPGATAALGATAAPAAGAGAPVIGGGTAAAGSLPDISSSQIASQVSQPGAAASGATGATDVGSLSPGTSGGTPFGSDVAPQAASEGKPDVPDSGGGNFFGKGGGLNAVLNDPAARLGIAALPAVGTLIAGQPSVPPAIAGLQPGGNISQPLINAENSQLAAANAGTLTAPQAANVAQFRQQAQSALYQQLAKSGIADPTQDSRYVSGMAQIEQQAQAMQQQYIQQEFTTGFAAAGQAAGMLGTAANAQVASDNSFQTALNAAMQSFGLVEGLGSRAP